MVASWSAFVEHQRDFRRSLVAAATLLSGYQMIRGLSLVCTLVGHPRVTDLTVISQL